jgi:hypothetical protein
MDSAPEPVNIADECWLDYHHAAGKLSGQEQSGKRFGNRMALLSVLSLKTGRAVKGDPACQ